MAGITHAFVSGIADGADTTLVRPVDWNAVHAGLLIVRKTADESVNNSTTLQNDDHLFLAVAANEVWSVFIRLRTFAATGVTQDSKLAFTVPTNGSFLWNPASDIGILLADELLTPKTTGVMTFYMAPAGVERALLIWGLYIGGNTAGNLQLQWAQNVAQAYDHTIKQNSFLIAYKLV